MSAQIQLRNGTAAQWTTKNPLLAVGEVGIENDTRKMKSGDGVTLWNSLPYISGGSGGATTYAALTDGATVDLPTINAPLANALARPIIRTTAEGAPTHPAASILSIGQMCRVGDGPSYTWYRAETLTSWARDETLLGTGVRTALALPVGTNGSVQLYGEPMAPTAIIIPDMAGIIAPAGSIGRRAGAMVMADGVTPGGNFVEGRTIKGFLQKPDAALFNKIQKFKLFQSEASATSLALEMFGQVTLRPQGSSPNFPSVTEIGIGFAFNTNSNLSKDHASNPWFYAELHPTPGTAKNLTYLKANIECETNFGTDGLPETHWGIPTFCKEYAEWSTGNDAIKTGTLSLFANPSFELTAPSNQDSELWLMVYAKTQSGGPAYWSIHYDLTINIRA